MNERIPAAAWYRVSHGNGSQQTDNQVPDVQRLAAHRDLDIVATFTVSESAFNVKTNGEYEREIARLLQAAHEGQFKILLIWAADRLTRGGIEELLKIIRQLRERGVSVVSVREPWLDGSNPAVAELLTAIMGWVANQESARRSERVKAGLARRAAEGKPIGRQAGATDKAPRRKSGYQRAWEPGGARRAPQ